ncbi:MAG: hypothetical protein IT384_19380 [Deltaproteobacteria bacterium]|nr:hypothetical protein [Deltaproteobacteria bacterium]
MALETVKARALRALAFVRANQVTLRRIAMGVAVLGLLVFGPHAWWLQLPYRRLEVVVVDKSIPFPKYREHQNLHWLLHAWKVIDHRNTFIEPTRDYRGFDPFQKRGHDLVAADLEHAAAVFIADTYGVYVGDYLRPGEVAALERSPKIYGGLTSSEAASLINFARRGGLVIGEFNTFASPTPDGVRAEMERLFGARWTKWVARYWPDVRDENEVPPWIGRVYERVYQRPFDLEGAALIFVRDDVDMVVLQPEVHLEPEVLLLERTGGAPELEGLPDTGEYRFWLDVVEAREEDVLYQYRVATNPDGAVLLRQHGLGTRFPAVIRHRAAGMPGHAWYFAGDFIDTAIELGDPERAWLLPWRRYVRRGTPEERFFWGWYTPVLDQVLFGEARGQRSKEAATAQRSSSSSRSPTSGGGASP